MMVVNKVDAVAAEALPHVRALLRSLNPRALLLETAWGAVPLREMHRQLRALRDDPANQVCVHPTPGVC